MISPALEREIFQLRACNFTPRQIARYLGLRVADVKAAIAVRGEAAISHLKSNSEPSPIANCWVNLNCGERLLDDLGGEEETLSSLGLIIVARFQDYHRFLVCTYLVDYCCLGLKDTMGVRMVDKDRYNYFLRSSFLPFPEGYREISLEEAQAIVLGSIYYAARLGFEPHPDFAITREHLGQWETILPLQFGRQGKPLYINGPYDNTRQIIRTLRDNVGCGNFDYILGIG
ncbi:MAG: DNA-binding response regulator [Cyanobacteria bacterium SBLK]|nr:DNA-binding response regulator [Cyanobacteria bacterium SBLK]